VSARDTQALSVTGRIHLNINTNQYQASRAFYRELGFARAIEPFPETNTLEMAHSMGMEKPYRMHA
jgi:predicted lactoylglutathione lyase